MNKLQIILFCIGITIVGCGPVGQANDGEMTDVVSPSASDAYEEVDHSLPYQNVGQIPLPNGYRRISQSSDSFGDFLRNLKIKTDDEIVHLYDGSKKRNQGAHYCILDIDVGEKDLQQCADAVMRLRAEYLFEQKKYDELGFNFTSGDYIPYSRYAKGERVSVTGNKITWRKRSGEDYSYDNFRKYLDLVFTYAGTYSLSKELHAVDHINLIKPGDVFIQGGFPGHAVIVVDVAQNDAGQKIFLLAQSYMPAQEIHILVNSQHPNLSPWYSVDYGTHLYTPEWTFQTSHLMEWPI